MGIPFCGCLLMFIYLRSYVHNIYIYFIYIYIYIYMGPLGKPEADDVNNFANRSLVPAKTSEMVIHYKDSKGVDRIKGGRDMKASQAYPKMCSGQTVFWCIWIQIQMVKPMPGLYIIRYIHLDPSQVNQTCLSLVVKPKLSHWKIMVTSWKLALLPIVEGFLIQSRSFVLLDLKSS